MKNWVFLVGMFMLCFNYHFWCPLISGHRANGKQFGRYT